MNHDKIRPIETAYKGCRFRSRTEARWAVFFDAIGVEWEYEKEGYDLGPLGWYLPDFWLPRLRAWLEVKGSIPKTHEIARAKALAALTECNVYVFDFSPQPFTLRYIPFISTEGAKDVTVDITGSGSYILPSGDWNGCISWGVCPRCGAAGIGLFGEHVATLRSGTGDCGCGNINDWQRDNAVLRSAYAAARGARFEHGERPGLGGNEAYDVAYRHLGHEALGV